MGDHEFIKRVPISTSLFLLVTQQFYYWFIVSAFTTAAFSHVELCFFSLLDNDCSDEVAVVVQMVAEIKRDEERKNCSSSRASWPITRRKLKPIKTHEDRLGGTQKFMIGFYVKKKL